MTSPGPAGGARVFVARLRRAASMARADGSKAVARRLLVQAMDSLGPSLETDVGLHEVFVPPGGSVPPARPEADRVRVGWVMTPPSAGSGGHTTALRLVQALEKQGHDCTLYLSQPRGAGDLSLHRGTFDRHFPPVKANVADAAFGFAPCDVLVATGWPSAYTVRSAAVAAHRAYLVQDYEPWFYPSGSQSALATATYRFGFHGLTAGRWLAQKLGDEFGMPCDPFEFGADERYGLADEPARRDGVVFYARPNTPRRAFELGVMVLAGLAVRHPELTIHMIGAKIGRPLPFPFVDHGVLSAEALSELYNRCVAGLVLSMSNLSLVPLELLAAGCIPVVNDAPSRAACWRTSGSAGRRPIRSRCAMPSAPSRKKRRTTFRERQRPASVASGGTAPAPSSRPPSSGSSGRRRTRRSDLTTAGGGVSRPGCPGR